LRFFRLRIVDCGFFNRRLSRFTQIFMLKDEDSKLKGAEAPAHSSENLMKTQRGLCFFRRDYFF
jgi:hypothetical protein